VHHAVSVQLAPARVEEAIGTGVWLALAWALVRRRDLARFAVAAWFGLTCFNILQAAGRGAVANAPPDMAADAAIGLLALGAGVLLFTGPSSRYYRPKPRPVTSWHRTFSTR